MLVTLLVGPRGYWVLARTQTHARTRTHIWNETDSYLAAVNYKTLESCTLVGCYGASSVNPLQTFRDNVSVPSSKVKRSSWISWPLKMGPICCPETSAIDYDSTLRNIPEERRFYQRRGWTPGITRAVLVRCVCWICVCQFRLKPWRWKHCFNSKRGRMLCTRLYCVTTPKTAVLIFNTKISNLRMFIVR
jgi:hypothetical protein